MKEVSLNALHKEKPHALSPFDASTDFDFDFDVEIEAGEDQDGRDRRSPEVVIDKLATWILFDVQRQRYIGIKYRSYAAAIVINRQKYFPGMTVSEIAKRNNLQRIVLHRYIAAFAERFGIRRKAPPSQGLK